MPKPRTGTFTIDTVSGRTVFRGRLRLADGTKSERFDLPADMTERQARAYLAGLQAEEDSTHAVFEAKQDRAREAAQARGEAVEGETCSAYRKRLDAHRKELGRRCGGDDASTWRVWLADRIGHLPVAKVTRDDVERVRDDLDEAIARHKRTDGKDGVSAKRAANIWSVVTTTFKAACMAKRRDLRVRTDNPCASVLPPERGDSRRRTFVYPNEAASLFACRAVPLPWRETYAVACYLYLRPGELRALTVGDVDFDAQVVHVKKAYDERAGDVKAPKTRNGIRDVPIHPNLVPLLRRLVDGRKSADLLTPLVSERSEFERAKTLRTHLELSGATRPRLYENTATTMHVGFRSWRDTGVTWLALAGVDVAKMQRRAGHDEISTTIGYVKTAEDVSGSIGEPFPPLPVCLVSPDPADVTAARDWTNDWARKRYRALDAGKMAVIVASPAGVEHRT
jgi:integrase